MHLSSLAALSLLLLSCGTSALVAETTASNWFFRAWQTEHGLPDNSISGISQAPDGYLWLGTNGGAIRFNGTQFNPLPLRDIPGLPSRQVRAMWLDREGNLWLGMERGPVIRIGDSSYQVFGKDHGLPLRRTMAIVDGPDERVWAAHSRQAFLIKGNEITRYDQKRGIPAGSQATFARDTDGHVWLANGGNLGRLSDAGFEMIRNFNDPSLRISPSIKSGLWLTVGSELIHLDANSQFTPVADLPDGSTVNAICEDRSDAVWIGTQRSGLLRVAGGQVENVATSHPSISCIYEDQESNIWVGTKGGGLNLVRPRAVRFIGADAGLPFASIRSSTFDDSGRLWAVGDNGQMAFRSDAGWQLDRGLVDGTLANCVAADPSGAIWVGTRNRGLLRMEGEEQSWFDTTDGLASQLVRSVLVARNGDVWIACDEPDQLQRWREGRISTIDHTRDFKAIRALAETADGTIWAGSSDGRIFRVEGDHLIDESDIDGPLSLSVRTLHATPDGSLWIGYAGDGLGHIKDGSYTRITMADGLFDDFISQIQDDGQGALWIAANRGMFQVSLNDLLTLSADPDQSDPLMCRVFGSNDGVPSIQPSRDYAPTASRSPDGLLFFPTRSGIVEVAPGQIRNNALAPPVILEKIALDGEPVAAYQSRSMIGADASAAQTDLSLPQPRLAVPPEHDKLVIDVAALSLASPENVQLRYRLEPIDETWQEVENRRSITFSRLPAGDYNLRVIACNNAGVWNQTGASLAVLVSPFFWETWWFRTGGGLLTAFAAAGLVFLGLRRKHRLQLQQIAAKQALEQERSRIARDIHDDLGASLTRITLLSQQQPSPPEEASGDTVLDQIHATSRHLMRSMEEVVWAVNPEHDTFDALANYLSNYGQGFLGIADVRCRLQLPISLPDRPLSAQIRHNLFLAFKEALNNAVKHARASEVRISLELGSDSFVLKVADDGEGIDPNASAAPMRPTSGSGLANMKNRMSEFGGTCILHSTLGQGTTVEFNVPFKISP